MRNLFINEALIQAAAARVQKNPSAYAVREVARFRSIKTPGRAAQARLVAGRQALAEALFELWPAFGGSFQKLTKAIRNGCGNDVDFDLINEQGAKALGL